MIDAVELLEMFNRTAETENIALARIHNADYEERETLDRLQALRDFWKRLYGKRNAL